MRAQKNSMLDMILLRTLIIRNSHRTGVSTFAIRTSQRTDQKLQKSFHLTDPKENFIFFPTALKIKNATHYRHHNDTETQY